MIADWPEGEPAARFVLPLPPSTNQLYVARRHGFGRARTSEYANWQVDAGKAMLLSPRPRISGKVAVLIEAGFSRRRDIDNIKPALDLLSPATAKRPHGMGIIDDDRWVDKLLVERVPGDKLTVSVWQI